LELKKKAAKLEKENAEIKQNINKAVDDRISEVFNEYGIEEILKKHGL
jgi:DNA-binding protein H-NS